MESISLRTSLAGLAALLMLGVTAPVGARANTYSLTVCATDFARTCSTPAGTITTVDTTVGGVSAVQVSIQLASGVYFFGNLDPSVMFDLSGISSITYGGTFTGFGPAFVTSGNIQSAGSHTPDPGNGTYNYGLFWKGGTGQSNADTVETLVFDVIAAGITTASFVPGSETTNNDALYFGLDLGTGCSILSSGMVGGCTGTGEIGATATPLPGTLALFLGPLLAAGGYLGLRRRRRSLRPAAA